MKSMWSLKRKFGNIGEDLACGFLMKQGFSIIERNYLRKWGEIDIIAKNKKILHFIEVKSVSCDTLLGVSRGTKDSYRPEDNLHGNKLKKLRRVIQTYLSDRDIPEEIEWKFDVIAVYIEKGTDKSKINFLEDIIL